MGRSFEMVGWDGELKMKQVIGSRRNFKVEKTTQYKATRKLPIALASTHQFASQSIIHHMSIIVTTQTHTIQCSPIPASPPPPVHYLLNSKPTPRPQILPKEKQTIKKHRTPDRQTSKQTTPPRDAQPVKHWPRELRCSSRKSRSREIVGCE